MTWLAQLPAWQKTLAAIVVIAGMGWGAQAAVSEWTSQIAANTDYRLIQTFERLSIIKRNRRLSVIEWRKYCLIGKQLGVFQVCPAR